MKLKALAAGALVALTLLGAAGIAGASPEPSGWDDANDQVVGAGSDTTYPFMQRAELLFNQAIGCDTINTSGDANLGKCLTGAAQSATDTKGNWDHDYFVGKFPVGSSAGVKALQLGQADYARSSRGPRATGESDLNFWAFGKDGLAITTFGTRTPSNITKAQIVGIYNCTITSWQAITGNPADAGKTIEPIGMNPASGTKASMDSYLGFDANAGACVKKLPSGQYPFENDAKPIIDAPTINEDNAIWWFSFAEYKSWNYKRQSAQAWTVDGIAVGPATIGNNSYPITRLVYHVTLDAITAPAGSEDIQGLDGGKQGAVRELTEFLCKTPTNHTVNDYSGQTNYNELTAIYSTTGYLRLPGAERTNGICRLVPGP